jgi:hypothetical protein
MVTWNSTGERRRRDLRWQCSAWHSCPEILAASASTCHVGWNIFADYGATSIPLHHYVTVYVFCMLHHQSLRKQDMTSLSALSAQQIRQASFANWARPVGFNSYSLIFNRMLNPSYDVDGLLQYCQEVKANVVRVMYPCYGLPDWTNHVLAAGFPAGRELMDTDFKSSFLTASDDVFNKAAARGIKLWVCLFWRSDALPSQFGETPLGSINTTSATYNFMARFARWFAARYANHDALGVYSFFNEQDYDATGVTNPTPAALGAVWGGLATEIRQLAPNPVSACNIIFLGGATGSPAVTFDSEVAALNDMVKGLDVVGLHIYVGNAFCGWPYPASPSGQPTDYAGGEGIPSYLSAAAAICRAAGKVLAVGETGMHSAQESDAVSTKKRAILKACSSHAAVSLLWDLAALPTPIPDMVPWQIKPGTPRGNTFAALAAPLNASRLRGDVRGAGTLALRFAAQPRFAMSSTRGAAQSVIGFPSTPAMSTQTLAVMYWLRKDLAPVAPFERIASCAVTDAGFLILSGVAPDYATYIAFRLPGGGEVNNAGALRAATVGQWNHIAHVYRILDGGRAWLETWVNGMFWTGIDCGTSLYPGIPPATQCHVLGIDPTSGSAISLQDFTLAPSATPEDIWAHMAGDVLPQALLHLRADEHGVRELSRAAVPVTVGTAVRFGI